MSTIALSNQKYKKNIFKNCFTLSFEDEQVQKKFEDSINNKILMISYLAFSTLVCIIVISLLYTLEPPPINKGNIQELKYFGY